MKLSGRAEENPESTPVKIDGLQSEIRKQNFPNANQ